MRVPSSGRASRGPTAPPRSGQADAPGMPGPAERSITMEREVKLGARTGLVVPDLDGVVPGVVATALTSERLSSTYYDTADLRLARWGVTVRYRSAEPGPRPRPTAHPEAPDTGGAATGAARSDRAAARTGAERSEAVRPPGRRTEELPWTVKLPSRDGAPPGEMARTELGFAGTPDHVPAPVVALVAGLVRGAPLVAMARLRTDRSRVALSTGGGDRVAELDDDEVSVLSGGPGGRGQRVAARFRELEVELAVDGDRAVMAAVVDRLQAAGAGAPDPTPKVVRALGPRALDPPDVVAAVPGPDATVAEAVRCAIASSIVRLIRHDPAVRLGEDPESVHQARVATRRLRSDLRTFGPVLDPAWTEGLRQELGWVAELLGGVRDTDVLLARSRSRAGELAADDAEPAAALLARLEDHRERAHAALVAGLGSARYIELLDRLVEAAAAPAFLGQTWVSCAPVGSRPAGGPAGGGDDDGVERGAELGPASRLDDLAADVLPQLVRRPWRALARAVDELGDDPSDEDLHRVRIHAKRCRYAAEAATPVVGRRAQRLAQAVAGVQEVLGDFHDAVVAEAWLRRAAADGSVAEAFVAGQLASVERLEAARGRGGWSQPWRRASDKKLRTWLRSEVPSPGRRRGRG